MYNWLFLNCSWLWSLMAVVVVFSMVYFWNLCQRVVCIFSLCLMCLRVARVQCRFCHTGGNWRQCSSGWSVVLLIVLALNLWILCICFCKSPVFLKLCNVDFPRDVLCGVMFECWWRFNVFSIIHIVHKDCAYRYINKLLYCLCEISVYVSCLNLLYYSSSS